MCVYAVPCDCPQDDDECACSDTADLKCAACGHVRKHPTPSILADAREAEDAWDRVSRVSFAEHWRWEIGKEQAKIACLSVGRW